MAISLGSIVVELLANTGNFLSGMDKAGHQAKKTSKEIKDSFSDVGSKLNNAFSGALSSMGELGSVVGELGKNLSEAFSGIGESSNGIATAVTALGGLAAAGIAAAGALSLMAKEGAEVTERLAHISEKTGISTHDLQVFEAAGKTVGVSLEEMVTAFRKFDQAITGNGRHAGAATSVLKQLGITARDNREALLQAADSFKGMEDGPKKAADAVALFGKSGLNMIPFLNKGRDGVLEFEDAVSTFGPKITKEGIANTEAWKVSVTELSLSWQNLAVTISDQVLPALTKTTTGIAGLVRGASVITGASLTAIGALLHGQNVGGAVAMYLGERTDEGGTQAELQALQRKNEAIALYKEHYKEIFDLEKSGGQAQLALSQAQEKITAAIQQEDFKTAAHLEATLPTLQAAADKEKQRLAAAKQLAATYEAIEKSFAKGASRPLLKLPAIDASKGVEALFGPQAKNPLEGAPDLGGLQFPDFTALKKDTEIGDKALKEFYANWDASSQATEEKVKANYDEQFAHFDGLLALGQIDQKQFNDVIVKLAKEREAALEQVRQTAAQQQKSGQSSFADSFRDMFAQIRASGQDFARSLSMDIGDAIQSLNHQLAAFVATGKGLSLQKLGQSLSENIFGSVLRKAESGALSFLGLGNSTKPDGSSAQAALWVQMSSPLGAAAGVGALPLGNLGGIVSLLGGGGGGSASLGNIGSTLGGIGRGIGGFFGSIASFFGGFLADGGDAQPGRAYIVGEKRPELFVPRSAGTVVPSLATDDSSGKSTTITFHQNLYGVTDADSFKKSAAQIASGMTNALQRGTSRNGR
jgi:hypothetical protein